MCVSLLRSLNMIALHLPEYLNIETVEMEKIYLYRAAFAILVFCLSKPFLHIPTI